MRIDGSIGLGGNLLLTPEEVAATSQTVAAVPRPRRAASTPRARRRTLPLRPVEVVSVAALVVVALVARTYHLTSLPFGMHGDEATVGLEAQRILREGNIGPYSQDAMGQPTGPIYLVALAIKLFGNTIFAVRIVPALAGTLTVLALYLVARRSFGVATALIAATLLATMSWHVHFARVGFPLETWPLCAVLTAGALVEALRGKRWRWWVAAGACAGLGLYSYNAQPFLLAVVGCFVAVAALQGFAREGRRALGPSLLGPLLMGAVLLLAALPLIDFAADPDNHYFGHSRAVSIFAQPEWAEQATRLDQARFLGGRYRAFWYTACCDPEVDGVDGSGLVPLAPAALLLLTCVGGVLGLRHRDPLVLLASLIVLLLPWASALTLQGLARRTFVIAPFLALLAALPLGWLVERGLAHWRRARPVGRAVPAAMVLVPLLVLAALGPYSLNGYYRAFAASQEKDWVFAVELTDAVNYLHALPEGSYVYFLSERWPVHHETIAFLAPEVEGEDRSREFGARTDLATDRTEGTIVYLFFGDYAERVAEVQTRYPHGMLSTGSRTERPPFVAYRVDLSAADSKSP